MTIFLILAPYGAFAMLMLVSSATVSLFAAAAMCLMVIAYDMLRGRSIKMLGAGSAILFTALGCYLALTRFTSGAVRPSSSRSMPACSRSRLFRSPSANRSRCNMPAKWSMPRRPDCPAFLTANYVITWAWALAFLLMMTANALLIYRAGPAAVVRARRSRSLPATPRSISPDGIRNTARQNSRPRPIAPSVRPEQASDHRKKTAREERDQ